MYCDMLPELRAYLEGVLDDILAQAGMTMGNQKTREKVLWMLLKELDTFVFLRIRAALPLPERAQFNVLLEQGVTEEELQAVATRCIPNLPAFAESIFVDFRADYVKPSKKWHYVSC